MATREYGFMGEPFPSKKFQSVIAEYLGHIESIQESIQETEPGHVTQGFDVEVSIHEVDDFKQLCEDKMNDLVFKPRWR